LDNDGLQTDSTIQSMDNMTVTATGTDAFKKAEQEWAEKEAKRNFAFDIERITSWQNVEAIRNGKFHVDLKGEEPIDAANTLLTGLNIIGTAADVGEYTNATESYFRYGNYWYRMQGSYGRAMIANRLSTISRANALGLVSKVSFIGSVPLSLWKSYSSVAKNDVPISYAVPKLGIDLTVGWIGTFTNVWGAAAAVTYFIFDQAGMFQYQPSAKYMPFPSPFGVVDATAVGF
jgi:hypothetical protein